MLQEQQLLMNRKLSLLLNAYGADFKLCRVALKLCYLSCAQNKTHILTTLRCLLAAKGTSQFK